MTRFHNGKTKAGMAVILLILGFCLLSKIVIGISALRDNVYVMREIVKCPPLSRHEFLIDPNTCSSHYAAICLAR